MRQLGTLQKHFGFHLLARGNVHGDPLHAQRLSVGTCVDASDRSDPPDLSVGQQHAKLLFIAAEPERICQGLTHVIAIIGVQALQE